MTYKRGLITLCCLILVLQIHAMYNYLGGLKLLGMGITNAYMIKFSLTPVATVIAMVVVIIYLRRLDVSNPDKKLDALDDY